MKLSLTDTEKRVCCTFHGSLHPIPYTRHHAHAEAMYSTRLKLLANGRDPQYDLLIIHTFMQTNVRSATNICVRGYANHAIQRYR